MVSTVFIDYDEELVHALSRVYGDDLYKFLEYLKRPPSRYYVRVNTLRISTDELVKRLMIRGIEVYRDENLDEAVYFPVRYNPNIPSVSNYVIADKKAAESVILGSDLYIPGVVGGKFRKGSEVNILTPYGDVIAYGIAMIDSEDVKKGGKGVAVKTIKSLYEVVKVRELPEYGEGLIYPQALPSILVSRLLKPQADEVVVDMCAAPGGKTGHLVELSRGKALIYAFDHSAKKVENMVEELSRLGHLSSVKVFKADSRYLHIDFPWLIADKVLIDPPCSTLGVIPKVFDVKRYKDVVTLSKYQFQFISEAVRIVRKGGLIAYSTCTVTLEENEENIRKAVKELGLEVVEPYIKLGAGGLVSEWWGEYLLRFHPHIHGTPGYFIALLRKN
jgi:16S rRNA (cytosine967-C5)-methyltransferase